MRRLAAATIFILVLTSCGGDFGGPAAPLVDSSVVGDWSPDPVTKGSASMFAWTDGSKLVINTGDGPRDFIAGVNLGSTIPGSFPAEQAVRAEDFRRWFPQMRDLGIQAIRIYTIMPPHFYQELRAFNLENPTRTLLIIHGVWIPEERFYATTNLYDTEVVTEFKLEIERAVAAAHGDIVLPERRGHAGGTYDADISPWLMSWAIGVEWDPHATFESDEKNAGREPYAGKFFSNTSGEITPTEAWLAEMLDHLATLESDRGVTMPLTFVNWPTTDPLRHPDELLDVEDMVDIDHNHVAPTSEWAGGFYASYHAYPYYPDFQRYEDGVAGFLHRGEPDN